MKNTKEEEEEELT